MVQSVGAVSDREAASPGRTAEAGLPPLVDPEALERFLARALPGEGPLSVERHQAGHSNETFFVRRGAEEWVLRRPPRPPYLPTAHDVKREYTVLRALAGTGVRAPRPVLLCEDPSVIGAPFYLMERVHGVVIRDRVPAAIDTPEGRRRIGEELVDAAAELHAVDCRAVGLEGWGKPTGYIRRQLARWRAQLEGATAFTRPLPDFVRVGEWLEEHQPPEQPPAIVHGDYKLDNVVFAPDPPARLVAILDWEMSTIGDPLADVGWMLSFWRERSDPPDPLHGALNDVFSGEGWPTRAALIARYEERTGRSMTDIRFYTVLALWKLGILLEGSYARHLRGTTDDPFFALLEEGVPAIGARALEIIRGG
jgi:aminoglycoside phosphotransferase (APT) family kinase protein